jgi:hypothetical protein
MTGWAVGRILELVVFKLKEGTKREQFLATDEVATNWMSLKPWPDLRFMCEPPFALRGYSATATSTRRVSGLKTRLPVLLAGLATSRQPTALRVCV